MSDVSMDEMFVETWYAQWRERFPAFAACDADTSRLRLILGVGRGGTTWLSRVLGETGMPIRLLLEGLFHLKPKLEFAPEGDHTAISYRPRLPEHHPLLCVYHAVATPMCDWTVFGLPFHLKREDPAWRLCLMKEVHSLLATEGLLHALQCPALFVVRDPVYVVDSLFARDGVTSIYLRHESQGVREARFFSRFIREDAVVRAWEAIDSTEDDRERGIREKVLTVACMNRMFRVLASEMDHVRLVEYAVLCSQPEAEFERAAAFLGVDWDARAQAFLASTMHSDAEKHILQSVVRVTSEQLNRPLKFFADDEVDRCRAMLAECGLDECAPVELCGASA
ncbi:MAG: hypothetical protein JXA69_09235 [Phycisphaerae bacterium]|nr:hypothetical protein [Phycisphaerae bacterium]